ncbi:MAG TPA: hypothetical protein PLA87_05855 [Pseudomonadota bacterium]|nr:hypothetical protein [Pseudomonadota bacterium]
MNSPRWSLPPRSSLVSSLARFLVPSAFPLQRTLLSLGVLGLLVASGCDNSSTMGMADMGTPPMPDLRSGGVVITCNDPPVLDKRDVNIATAMVTGKITVGGADSDSPYGSVSLRNTITGDSIFLGQTDDKQYARMVVPGSYDIYYSWSSSDPAPTQILPRNANALIQSAVVITDGQKLDIDIPTATISGQIKVAGKTVSSTYGLLYLRNVSTGDSVFLGRTGNIPYSRMIVPGTYDVYYSWDSSDPAPTQLVPRNSNALLQAGVTVADKLTLNLDIPTVMVTGQATVAGQRVSSTYGVLTLEAPSGDSVFLGRTGMSTYSRLVIPGSYSVMYSWDSSDPAPSQLVPRNSGALIQSGLALAGGATPVKVDVDIPTVTVSGKITVAGKAVSSTYGVITVQGVGSTDSAYLGRTGGATYSRLLVPGTYHVHYSWDSSDPAPTQVVPRNSNARILGNIPMDKTQTLDIDVPMVTLSGQVTVAGQATASTYGTLSMRGENNDSFYLGRTGMAPYKRALVPGKYDLYYSWDSSDPAPTQLVPRNTNSRLRAAVEITKTDSLDINIPTRRIEGFIKVGGELSPSTYGSVTLQNAITSDSAWLGQTGEDPFRRLLIPGIYTLQYSWNSSDPAPTQLIPRNTAAAIGCMIVAP